MSNPSKAKGSGFERELVDSATLAGMKARRAWGSNGASLGEAEAVDVVIDSPAGRYRVQAKRRRSIPGWLTEHVAPGVDVTAVREDRGQTHVILTWAEYLRLIGRP